MAGSFAEMAGGMPSRLAGFTGGVARFDGGLTGYARFARCAGFTGFALYGRPCCEAGTGVGTVVGETTLC